MGVTGMLAYRSQTAHQYRLYLGGLHDFFGDTERWHWRELEGEGEDE